MNIKLEIKGEKDEEPGEGIKLTVRMSPISGSGIARVNSGVLKEGKFEEGKPHLIVSGDRKRAMRLVADDLMERNRISIRRRDMEKLGVVEGDEVLLSPSMRLGKRLKEGLSLFKTKGDR